MKGKWEQGRAGGGGTRGRGIAGEENRKSVSSATPAQFMMENGG